MGETSVGARYNVVGQFEPGSRGRVLRNFLGIKRKHDMDEIETREQLRALQQFIGTWGQDHRFTAEDVRSIHRIWLGSIYHWAGEYRQVNISKEGFLFAAASQIPHLMAEFEDGSLSEFTPCQFGSIQEQARAIAVVHTELLLIHPFREGNGRVARLLATLMALQAELPPLYFGDIRGKRRKEYFGAVRAGLDRNYEPMERVFRSVVRRTLQIVEGKESLQSLGKDSMS